MRRAQPFASLQRGAEQTCRFQEPVSHGRVGNDNAHQCASCHYMADSKNGLEIHAKESRHPAFSCFCGSSFTRLCSLNRHINDKAGPGVFTCDWCDEKAYHRQDKLHDHLKSFHKFSSRALDLIKSQSHQRRSQIASVGQYSLDNVPSPGHQISSHITPPGFFSSSSVSEPFLSSCYSAFSSSESSPLTQVPNVQTHVQDPTWTSSGNVNSDASAFTVSPSTHHKS